MAHVTARASPGEALDRLHSIQRDVVSCNANIWDARNLLESILKLANKHTNPKQLSLLINFGLSSTENWQTETFPMEKFLYCGILLPT